MSKVVWAERADAAAVADHIAGAILGRARALIAVPGGKTPAPILERLAQAPIDWEGVEIGLTDDRLVPETHPASNFGLLSRCLAAVPARIHPLVQGWEPGRFDLVWLGLGADGHVASVFPSDIDRLSAGTAAVRVRPDPLPAEAPFERLTLPLPALANAGDIILVAKGADKRRVLEEALAGRDMPVTRLLSLAAKPIRIFWSER